MVRRPRRNRKNASIRKLVSETALSPHDFVLPVFVKDTPGKEEVASMPGVFRHDMDSLIETVYKAYGLGIQAVAVFPVISEDKKDKFATFAENSDCINLKAIGEIKARLPEITIVGDIAMDPYSSDGHDGIVDEKGNILNDETLEVLGEMAIAQANAGVDIVAPSDMMDGRIRHIRNSLDTNGFSDTSILSYAVKYASSFYGPFRDACKSAPKSGDKKTYQMDPANSREALLEAELDMEEGADILMVKPGLPYLDVIKLLADSFDLPIATYNVSGEYAALKFASEHSAINYKSVVMETMLSFKRAGADIIFSYHALEVAEWLNN